MSFYRVIVCGLSHVGKVRPKNEDSFGVFSGDGIASLNPESGFLECLKVRSLVTAISDGMGGGTAGELASLEVMQTVATFYGKEISFTDLREFEASIQARIHLIHRHLLDEGRSDDSKKNMGATLTAAFLHERGITMAHVGDSRLYRLRKGSLEMLSVDHSEVWDLVMAGRITKEQARTYPKKNVLKQILGGNESFRLNPLVQTYDVKNHDLYLLCSDGITDGIGDELIHSILSGTKMEWNEESFMKILRKLMKEAYNGSGKDNLTAVILGIRNSEKFRVPTLKIPGLSKLSGA